MSNKKSSLILIGLSVSFLFSSGVLADTPYDRALGKGVNQNNSNNYIKNKNGHEIYPGIWRSQNDNRNKKSYEEVYPGVWKETQSEKVEVVDNSSNERGYRIVQRNSNRSLPQGNGVRVREGEEVSLARNTNSSQNETGTSNNNQSINFSNSFSNNGMTVREPEPRGSVLDNRRRTENRSDRGDIALESLIER